MTIFLLETVVDGMIFPAAITWQADPIGAAITAWAMPFTPVTAVVTYFAVPGLITLHDHSPAKRVPVGFLTLRTRVSIKQQAKRNGFMLTRQSVLFTQLRLCKRHQHSNVLNCTTGQMLNIHTIERILAVVATALFITWFVIFQASTAPILAMSFAIAVNFFLFLSALIIFLCPKLTAGGMRFE